MKSTLMLKYPGGEMAFWSVLLLLAGWYVSYDAFVSGKIFLASIFAVPAIGCALIWFDVRWAKWLVVAYLTFAAVGGGLMLSRNYNHNLLLRLLGAVYVAYFFATWNGRETSDDSSSEFNG